MSASNATSKKLFKKKAVAFSTQEVFDVGFKPDVEACFCTVSKLMFRNVINIDGSIDMQQMVNVKKRELWSYIYYLYQYNNGNLPEFVAMKNPSTGRADGMLFYQVVYGDDSNGASANSKTPRKLGTDIARLVYFINKLVHTYKDDMINPVIDYLKQLMKKEVFTKLSEIKVEMAPLSGNTNSNSSKKNVRVGFELTKP
jgi:hypothetical protein